MIFKNTDDFYEQLKDDYRDKAGSDKDIETARKRDGIEGDVADIDKKVRQSFLYKYFKKKKDDVAEEISNNRDLLFKYRDSKSDKYTLLHGAHLALTNKIISDDEFREIFLEANASSKSGQKKRAERFDKDPDKVREELEDRLLRDCAERFIDNANRRQSNSYLDVIEMLNQYRIETLYTNEESGTEFAGSAQIDLSEEYIEKCANLYEILLSEEENDELFVPLFIDKNSAAGVYIIGKCYLDKQDTAKACILSFYDIDYIEDDTDKDKELEDDGPSTLTISMNYKIFNSVEAAFDEFKAYVGSDEYYEDYLFHNASLPDGADNCFKSLFINSVKKYINEENAAVEKMKKQGNGFVP